MPVDRQIPRYDHLFVIVEENKDYGTIIGSPDAPILSHLARTYGVATNFYAEAHPSEPNYVALVGGSTYGIHDDGPYTEHTIDAPNLASQLETAHLTWKEYEESLPSPGSLALVAADPSGRSAPPNVLVYASKHSGFINFRSVQRDPDRAEKLVGFDQLRIDLESGHAPAFAMIVPNLCNEMHGSEQSGTPEDCRYDHPAALIERGDREVGTLVHEIMTSTLWGARGNAAIVITFDEDDSGIGRGGGHIPTVVVTNHGPRGASDATYYTHYSLLRTIEDAFGIHDYLMNANAPGVQPMLPLFR
jgi:phosphatidylinositol-3-phosphatase